jgi:dienelactone hydrolase
LSRALISGLLFVACGFAAEELPRGQVVDRVTARDNDRQSYALYLPSNYTPDRTWPILYCLDPGARGRVPVERFAAAAEKAGFIVAGSNNSRNGPLAPVQEAIRWLVTDTHARLAIDDSRVYTAGFSGGARVALQWAHNGSIAGVVACGAGFSEMPKEIPFKIFATAGFDDFNHDELYRQSREMAKRGVPHRFTEFEGGHDWLPAPLATEALDYFTGRLAPQSAEASKELDKQAAKYDRLQQEIANATSPERAAILHGLQKDAAKAADSADRRVARRVIGGVFVSALESSRNLMAQQEYAAAARVCEDAVMARPENAGAWYSLAIAQAASGNKRRSLEALEKAASNGFRDVARMEQEPLLASLRDNARYKAVVETLRK